MKTLTLLRHAKSGWDDPVARDFDRPLNARGQRAAAVIGRYLRSEELTYDRVLASPAVRVTETIAGVEGGYGGALAPDWDKRIYLASAATLLDLVREQSDAVARLLMVGHNPGLEDLAMLLVPAGQGAARDALEAKFPTATLAVIELPIDHWHDAGRGIARLERFVRPRDLDPTLGPDTV